MPLYPFQDIATGEAFELFYNMDKAPPIGCVRKIKGRKLRRLPSCVQPPTTGEFVVTAWSQRPNATGAQHYNKDGVPVLHGKQGVNQFLDAQSREVEKDGHGETQGEFLAFDGHKRL